ncbi:MAG: CBS domain-containing protein [Pseudomonadota bacterium]|nr:CBS domain-containing protein [Pseudomonadota bacterium]
MTRPALESTVSFSSLLKRAVVDSHGAPVGRLDDALVRLRDDNYPLLVGLSMRGASGAIAIDASAVELANETVSLPGAGTAQALAREEGDISVRLDVLGHRLLDISRGQLVRAYDVRLGKTTEGWALVGLDVHKHRWFQFGDHAHHPTRDWHAFLLLAGSQSSLRTRFSKRIRRLKPAQLADILEGASVQEQGLLLDQIHSDPELEADVFEELAEEKQARLLSSRSDQEIAEILSRMRADDVADAIMELPQVRRQKVLDLLPQAQNAKVLTLLGYNPATAGGLMSTDYIALSEDRSIADALQALRVATTQQPEALTTLHSLRADGTLAGTLSLVRALQLDASTLLRDAADPDTVGASPEEDIIAVTTRMADFNLLTLPVLDASGKLLGIVTVDDALEAAIPREWLRRAPIRR